MSTYRRRAFSPLLPSLVSAAALSCGGAEQPFTYSRELLNALAEAPAQQTSLAMEPVAVPPPARPVRANHAPELLRRDVPTHVIAGREVYFGIDVVDADHDALRISLGEAPAGAELDARTLTVRWRVPRNARGPQRFVVRVVEPGTDPAGGATTELPIEITAVARGPLPAAPAVVDPVIASMVTITSPDFLAATAREFPIDRVLEIAQDNALAALPEERRRATRRKTRTELFEELMASYATLHHNSALDVRAQGHAPAAELARWRLVAVRPRVNKHIEELRLAYRAVDLPYPVWAMFRFRLFRGPNPPNAEVVRENNAMFTRIVHAAFYGDPNAQHPRPGILEGRASAVAPAVAQLVRSTLTFSDSPNPLVRPGLVAIPQEARAGGGSEFAPDGAYQQGNAWAFTVGAVKVDPLPQPLEGGITHEVHVVNVPVSSFTFDIGATAAGDEFTSVCTPAYREGGPGTELGMTALCEADGTVRIRERGPNGRWVATRRDSLHEHQSVVLDELLGRVSLSDPRRRNFEENGMTCVQCHMRNFDDGVLSERQVSDPRVHEPITPAHSVERVAMQVLPLAGVARSSWFEQQETAQVCDLGRRFHAEGFASTLPCPEGY